MADLIVTVHGTNDGADADVGSKWWQLGSPFIKELVRFWPGETEIRPFHWSGANSERARAAAAKAFVQFLKTEAQGREDVFIIGHSHGGNVIARAVRNGIPGRPERYTIATVGAPFLSSGTSDQRRWGENAFWSVINNVVLWPVAGTLGALPFALLASRFAPWAPAWAVAVAGFAFGLAGLAGLRVVFAKLRSALIARRAKRYADPDILFRRRLAVIYHNEDEAISLLSRALLERGPVAPEGFAMRFLAPALFAALVVAAVAYVPYSAPRQLFEGSWNGPAVVAVTLALAGVLLLAFHSALLSPVRRGVQMALTAALSPLLDKVSRRSLDGVFHQILRSSIFGADADGESVTRVSANLDESWRWAPLQQPHHDALIRHCEPHVINAWERFRSGFALSRANMETAPPGESSALTNLNFAPTWRELLHTSYFDVPELQKLIIYALVERARGDLRAQVHFGSEFHEVFEPYAAMRATDRYTPIYYMLLEWRGAKHAHLDFARIDDWLFPEALPAEARTLDAWWANETNHWCGPTYAWRDAGYRVVRVDRAEGRVIFEAD
ncbi:MAG: hypothetical protein R3C25_05730 [Hyphomonadaceae bacterium]